jgi:hypothetical protein
MNNITTTGNKANVGAMGILLLLWEMAVLVPVPTRTLKKKGGTMYVCLPINIISNNNRSSIVVSHGEFPQPIYFQNKMRRK